MSEFYWFSITQIFREIKFGELKSAKSAILTHLGAMNFNLYEFLHFFNARIDQINKIKSSKNGKNGIFGTSGSSKIDFT